jgi:hypothetical protein
MIINPVTTTKRIVIGCFLLGVVVAASTTSAATRSKAWKLELGTQVLYESNIFHSFADTAETNALLNSQLASLSYRMGRTSRLRHTIQAYAELDLYPSYSSRNKSALGLRYEPVWRYKRGANLQLGFDFARRKKDLVDDEGQVLARTLKKWELDLSAINNYNSGPVKTQLGIGYTDDNYDERDTTAIVGGVRTSLPLKSYDYTAYDWMTRLGLQLTSRLEIYGRYRGEKRSYKERRTYTVRYGAYKGRPFAIREFLETTFETGLSYDFFRQNQVGVGVDLVRRHENFENFYGYFQRQYRASLRLIPGERHKAVVSFRFKNKDYANYWNSRVGRLHRIWIEYAEFQIDYDYRLSDVVTLTAYVKNFNKVSNDRAYDYQDFTAGTGVRVAL